MRTICLDVGEARIGVAVTDPLGFTAQGVETIRTRGIENDIARVTELCRRYETERVLIGLPLNMDGSHGFQADHAVEFGTRLRETGLKIRYQDERMTTISATRTLIEGGVRREKRKDVVDKLAACYILESFLQSGGWEAAEQRERKEAHDMADEKNLNEEMLDEEDDAIVELTDEDGNTLRFEHIMTLEHKGRSYICLAPAEEMADIEEDELVIMRIEQDEDGSDMYITLDDDKELSEVYEEYLQIAEADE